MRSNDYLPMDSMTPTTATLAERRLQGGRNPFCIEALHSLRLRLHQEELTRQGWEDFTAQTYEGF